MICKIRIEHNCGYLGLLHVDFPVTLDAHIGYGRNAYVQFTTMSHVQGWKWEEGDTVEGGEYVFLRDEYEIIY